MASPREFKCLDCGNDVITFGLQTVNDNDVCLTCEFIRSLATEADRVLARNFLHKRDK